MNTSAPIDYGDAPYPRQVEIDDLCDRFETELKKGRRPRADEFVHGAHADVQAPLVAELLKLELDYRRDEAETVRQEYESRLPAFLDVIRGVGVSEIMTLSAGSMWGEFRIEHRIGAGGMGVVYQAYDTKLERKVALKFLPARFAQDHQRLLRFEREAKTLAGLNHPNIATLHSLEESLGRRFLVLEFVSGNTLAEILGRHRLSLGELTAIFAQIAQAIESAHDAGVIHRDLKPSNVMITTEGVVKVLDFGLASSNSSSRSSEDNQLADSAGAANLEMRMRPGNIGISGTLPYMSPEQIEGRSLDKRCDIWAFGCCLYEALSNQRAFVDETSEDVRRAIAERDPDWTLLRDDAPDSLTRLVRRCLTKDARHRLRDIGDARIELQECQTSLTTGPPPQKSATGLRTSSSRVLFMGVCLVAGLIALGLLWPKRDVDVFEARLAVPLPPGLTVADAPALALSPDGRLLAYVASDEEGKRRLFLRRIGEFQSRELAGTDGAAQPFFSPDNQQIGFFADHGLKTVSVSGGQPILLCDAQYPMGAFWSRDGRIVFSWNWGHALDLIWQDGTKRKMLARTGDAYVYSWPQLLPDGKTLVFGDDRVMMADLEQLEKEEAQLADPRHHSVLIPRGSFARYLNGHLIYGYRGTLHSVEFGLDPPRVTGQSQPVAKDLWTSAGGGAQFSTSSSGNIAYVPGMAMEEGQLVWKSRRADDPPKPVWPGFRVYESFRLSPDRTKVAIGVLGSEGYDVWIYDFDKETYSNLDAPGENRRPIWHPDGKRLIFLSNRNNQHGLYIKELGSTEPAKLLVKGPSRLTPVCLSRDQTKLIYYGTSSDSREDEDIVEFDFETGTARPALATDEDECQGSLSPDGDWMVYTTNRATRNTQVFVDRYPPDRATPIRVSTELGGLDPMWSLGNEDELFYLSGDDEWLMSAKFERAARSFVEPEPIFSARPFINVPGFSFDFDENTDRFLLIQKRNDKSPKTEIRLILNWSR